MAQIYHHKHGYTPEMAMRQVGYHLIRNPSKFYKYIEQELLETGESYESYCYNVYHGNVWGDDLIVAAFGDMWNIAISIVSPISRNPIHLFHNKETPDVVVVANGGCWTSDKGSTHFSATSHNDTNWKVPGAHLAQTNLNVDTAPKLEPKILSDKVVARQLAIREYIREEQAKTLDMLHNV